MADVVTLEKRSLMMSGIKSRDTKPELFIRNRIHHEGFRYLLHGVKLPGKPDLVFPKYKAVIFINGCFWHAHDCTYFKWPQTRAQFWKEKLEGNRNRDQSNIGKLNSMGWRVGIVWECSLQCDSHGQEKLIKWLSCWLKSSRQYFEIKSPK
jgi:DNA mismatch endonuclease (patch repair protein)